MVKRLTSKDCLAITKIHTSSLAGDFLPSLGFNFLKTFYDGVIGKCGVYGFGVFEDGKIHGFVIGTTDSSKFFSRAIKAHFLKLSLLLTVRLIKNPTLVKNVLETLRYSKKAVGPKAELVVIAVDEDYQGKGVGKLLIEALESAFRKEEIKRYKLTVHADKKAVGFYEHLGYSRRAKFSLYGKIWYIYERKITKEKRRPNS